MSSLSTFLILLLFTPITWGAARLLVFYAVTLDRAKPIQYCIHTWPVAALMVAIVIGQLEWISHHIAGWNAQGRYGGTIAFLDMVPMLFIMMFYAVRARRSMEAQKTIATSKPMLGKTQMHEELTIATEPAYTLIVTVRQPITSRPLLKLIFVAFLYLVLPLFAIAVFAHRTTSRVVLLRLHVCRAFVIAGFGWLVFIILRIIARRDRLVLSDGQMKLECTVPGRRRTERLFKVSEMENPRYDEWEAESSQSRQMLSGLRFEVGSSSYTFGRALSREQVQEIVTRLRAATVTDQKI